MSEVRSQTSSNIFKILRLCLGLSLNDMSKRCGVSAIYLSELESGRKTKPSDEILHKIADACDIKVQTLRFFVEQQKNKSLDYQKCLMESLDRLAEKIQNSTSNDCN